jgi:uncharacterized OB-fold protein
MFVETICGVKDVVEANRTIMKSLITHMARLYPLRRMMANRFTVFTCKLCGSQTVDYSEICWSCRTSSTYKTRLKDIKGLKMLSDNPTA